MCGVDYYCITTEYCSRWDAVLQKRLGWAFFTLACVFPKCLANRVDFGVFCSNIFNSYRACFCFCDYSVRHSTFTPIFFIEFPSFYSLPSHTQCTPYTAKVACNVASGWDSLPSCTPCEGGGLFFMRDFFDFMGEGGAVVVYLIVLFSIIDCFFLFFFLLIIFLFQKRKNDSS